MAIVAFARNGIGMGHISRMLAFCNGLARSGLRPYLFAEGTSAQAISHIVPTVSVGEPGPEHSYSLRQLESRLNHAALLSDPACILEDTHPLSLTLDPRIRRFLLVRPLVFPAMAALAESSASTYEKIFVTDRPDSPTWPYCVIHVMSVQGFTACRSSISRHAGQGFHGMPVQHFTACRSSS
jgi:hypothetical protein